MKAKINPSKEVEDMVNRCHKEIMAQVIADCEAMFKENEDKYLMSINPKCFLGEYLMRQYAKRTGQTIKFVWGKEK